MNQNRFLYTVKLIACLAVITIHAKFPDPFGDYVAALARFAVPFFFAVSGRYLLSGADTSGEIRSRASRSLKKTLKITVIVYLIYQLPLVRFTYCTSVPCYRTITGTIGTGPFSYALIFFFP